MPIKLFIVALLFSVFPRFGVQGQAFTHPVEYLNFLGSQSGKVSEEMWDYARTIAKGRGARKIESRRKDLLLQLTNSMKAVRSRPSYKKQEYIKVAFVNYFQTNINLLNEDYAKMMNMEEVAEKSYDAMEQYIMIQEKANAKQSEASTELNSNIQRYAAENTIALTEEQTKTARKLDRASKAFDYFNPIYLILFKAMVQENNFMAAYNANKIGEAEQAKTAMVTYADEGIAALANKLPYEGDGKLIAACQRMLNFYKSEGEGAIGQMLTHKAKEVKFQKLNAIMSKKKKGEAKEEEINEFNAAVQEYNQSVKEINKVLSDGNKERSKENSNWQDSAEDFLKKHAA